MSAPPNLAKSQTDIGESSNLAQIAQTYECNFEDNKFSDYVCVLSVLAQAAILPRALRRRRVFKR